MTKRTTHIDARRYLADAGVTAYVIVDAFKALDPAARLRQLGVSEGLIADAFGTA